MGVIPGRKQRVAEKGGFPRMRGGDPSRASSGGQLVAALALELGGSAQTLCDITILDQGGAAMAVLCPARGVVE